MGWGGKNKLKLDLQHTYYFIFINDGPFDWGSAILILS